MKADGDDRRRPVNPESGGLISGTFALLGRFKRDRRLVALLIAINIGGVAYGFYYYSPQFAITQIYLWPFIPDSPLSVFWIVLSLSLALVGRSNRWIDALAFVSLVKVGLWTGFVLTYYGAEFGIFDDPLTSLNFHLFWLHLAMAVEAFVLVPGMRSLGQGWLALIGWFAFNDWLDYFYGGFSYAGCIGTRPITVPCRDFDVLIPVTLTLTALALALAIGLSTRRAQRVITANAQ